jgi:hypothetical protein
MASHTDLSMGGMSVAEARHASDASKLAEHASGDESKRYNVHWFRGTVFQVLVVGGVFFCAPGMYNALSGLGGEHV